MFNSRCLSFCSAQYLPARIPGISRASHIGLAVTESDSRLERHLTRQLLEGNAGNLGVADERPWPISTCYPTHSRATSLCFHPIKQEYSSVTPLSCTLSLIVSAFRCQRKWGSQARYTNDKAGTNISSKNVLTGSQRWTTNLNTLRRC